MSTLLHKLKDCDFFVKIKNMIIIIIFIWPLAVNRRGAQHIECQLVKEGAENEGRPQITSCFIGKTHPEIGE